MKITCDTTVHNCINALTLIYGIHKSNKIHFSILSMPQPIFIPWFDCNQSYHKNQWQGTCCRVYWTGNGHL